MWGSGEVLVQDLTSFQDSGNCSVYVHVIMSRTNNFKIKINMTKSSKNV